MTLELEDFAPQKMETRPSICRVHEHLQSSQDTMDPGDELRVLETKAVVLAGSPCEERTLTSELRSTNAVAGDRSSPSPKQD